MLLGPAYATDKVPMTARPSGSYQGLIASLIRCSRLWASDCLPHQVLTMAGLKLSDMDVIEFHEAFAGQVPLSAAECRRLPLMTSIASDDDLRRPPRTFSSSDRQAFN